MLVGRRPSHLYKYISLSSETQWDRLSDVLCNHRVFLSSPLDFNDPFDCVPCIVSPKSAVKWDIVGRRYAARIARDFGQSDAKKVRAGLSKLSDKRKRELLERASAESAEQTGVYCLSELADNVLMWSHYADNHKGICLRFDIGRSPVCDIHGAVDVIYQPERPHLPILRTDDDEFSAFNALRVKADFWAYEKEWRILMAGDARKHMGIPSNLITGAILGARCSDASQDRLRELVGSRQGGFEFSQAVVSSETFRLDVRPLP